MDDENNMLDCTKTMRRYILKTKQSAWAKSSRRIVVWSPHLTLPSGKKGESIPSLRNYPKQNHQDVRFLSTNDIEKDSSTVYTREKVTTESKSKATHGVAIVDSPPSYDFSYRRGDRFWLHIKTLKTDAKSSLTAPVINLRTYEAGTIPVQHVCWFPMAKGPSGELWTFGGLEKVVRGAQQQSWIWAVIQPTENEPTMCDMIQVTSDCEMKFSERVALFKDKLESMEQQSKEASSKAKSQILRSAIFPRQSSPFLALRRILVDVKNNIADTRSSLSSQTWGQPSSDVQPPNKRLCPSPIESTTSDAGPALKAQPMASLTSHSRRNSSITCTSSSDSRTLCSTHSPHSVNDEVGKVMWSLFASKALDKPFLGADDIAHDPTLIRAAYDRAREYAITTDQMAECGSVFCLKASEGKDHIEEENAKLAHYCSHNDPTCVYTQVLPPHRRRAHFHHPSYKCVFGRVDPLGTHAHCVTFQDFPGPRAHCIFRSWNAASLIPKGYQHTSCCCWLPGDIKNSTYDWIVKKDKNFIPPAQRPVTLHGKVKREMAKYGIKEIAAKTVDMSALVKYPDPTPAEVEALRRDATLLLSFWLNPLRDIIYPRFPDDQSRTASLESSQNRGTEEDFSQQIITRSSPGNGVGEIGDFPPGFNFQFTPSNTTTLDQQLGSMIDTNIDIDQDYFDQYHELWMWNPPIEFSVGTTMFNDNQGDSSQNSFPPKIGYEWRDSVDVDATY